MKEIIFYEDTHTYLVDGIEVPSVTTILKPITADHYGAINPSILDYARARGTAIHEALEELDLCGEVEVDGEIEGYVNAYIDFMQTYMPEWAYIENFCYHEAGYVGTVDRAGYIGKDFCVLDIKNVASPSKENLVSVCAQTAAYTKAICGKEDREVIRYGLYLNKDGTYRLVDCREYEKKYQFDGFGLFDTCLRFRQHIARVTEKGKRNGK